MYTENHGIPRSIRLDQAQCLVGNQVKTFCNKNNIDIDEAPVNNYRAVRLVERLIQTIKNRFACIEEEKLSNIAFHVKHALKIIIHQLRICKQKTTKISPFEAHFGRKSNTPLSVISTIPKLSNLAYESIVNFYLDEDTVMPEEILPDDKWLNGYRSDIEVEKGMSRATQEAKSRERASNDGESRFLRTKATRPILLKERAVELNLARKILGKRRSKKNLEGFYEVLAPQSHILKVSPTTSTIKESGKPVVTVRNSDIAKFGTQMERQTRLKAYPDPRGPRSGEKLAEELIQSHVKEFTRKQKGDKKMKHRKRDPCSGVSSSKSNISRAMRGRVPKIPNFLAMQNQQPEASTVSHSEEPTTSSTNTTATKQPPRSSDMTRRCPYYGFESPSPDSTIAAPPKRPRRAGDIENFQAPSNSVVETVRNIAEQQPAEFNVSPRIGEIFSPASRNPSLLEIDIPTLLRSMTIYEAENPDVNE